jgi:hypothetical protein
MAEADNKYANGKIYELVYKDKVYIGSTTTTLADRYSKHKCKSHNCGSRVLFEMAEADGLEVAINLIEDYPCVSKKELEVRERFYIEQCQDRVNKVIPGRSLVEYYHDNKSMILAKCAEYREANKDKASEQHAKYYQDHRDKIIERVAEHYQANKAEIAARKAVKVECECGVTHRRDVKARHERSQHHLDYLSRLRATSNLNCPISI